ncbi:unnamed protein product [Victoria cruziana]
MVKAYTHEHVYKHPWERVTSAFWRKFNEPENKAVLSHIIEVNTLSLTLDSSTGALFTTRAITVHAPGPRFLSRLIGQDFCHCVETTHVDPASRSMVSTSRNLSLRKFLEVEEKSSYHPHPANPDWTVVLQTTSISCSPVSAIAAMAEKIEQRCAERFQQNSAKGRDVMERICNFLEAESSKGIPL